MSLETPSANIGSTAGRGSCKSDEVEEEPDCIALLEVAHSVGQVIGYMWYHYCPPSRATLFKSPKTMFTNALESAF